MTSELMLVIDDREHHLQSCLRHNYPNIPFSVQRLQLGDIHLYHQGTLVVIIERKTLEDYASSIRDGRLQEQCQRLQEHQKQTGVQAFYIVEGAPVSSLSTFHRVSPAAIYSSFLSKTLRDHMPIIRTDNLTDTALVISKLYQRWPSFKTQSTEVSVIKPTKKKALSADMCYQQQLAQFPGISHKSAQAIARQFPSWKHLVNATCEQLAEVRLASGNRLGIKKARVIFQYIQAPSSPSDSSGRQLITVSLIDDR